MKYLKQCLDQYYFQPGHALWRMIEAKLLFPYLNELKKGKILDIGCGDGTFAQVIFKNKVAFGLDLSAKNVSRAAKSGRYKRTLVADACALPFPDESFDTILSNCVFEHIPKINKALSEASRVLKQRGYLLLTVPSEKMKREQKLNQALLMYHFYSPKIWRKKMKKLKIELVSYRYYFSQQALSFYKNTLRLFNSGFGPFKLFYFCYFLPLTKPLVKKFYQPILEKIYSQDAPFRNLSQGYALFLVGRKIKKGD